MPQLYRLIETGRSHFVLSTCEGPFLIDIEEFVKIRKFRRTILSQHRSEDTAIIIFIIVFIVSTVFLYILFGSDEPLADLLFNFLESAIVTCSVIAEGKVPLDKVIAIIIVALAVGHTPLILWSMRLLRRNSEIFEVMTMLETENEQPVREKNDELKQENDELKQENDELKQENDGLKQESEELDREISILIANNTKLKSQKKSILIKNNTELKLQKKKLESKLLQLEKTQKVLQNEFKTQKNKLVSEVKKADKQNEEFKEEKEELISQIKELKLKFKNAEKRNLMLEEESLKMKTMNLKLEKENDEKLCTVCLVDKKHILLQPCNHLCFCQKCYLHKKWFECPQCRQQIESVINIFT